MTPSGVAVMDKLLRLTWLLAGGLLVWDLLDADVPPSALRTSAPAGFAERGVVIVHFERDVPVFTERFQDCAGIVVWRLQGGGVQFGDLKAVDPCRDDWQRTDTSDPELIPVVPAPYLEEILDICRVP